MKTPIMMHSANKLRQMEKAAGYSIVGEAPWLDPNDWIEIVASQDRKRIRLVLLHARVTGRGSFTRLINGIWAAGLEPVIVEPSQSLIDWCHRHNYRRRMIGRGKLRNEVWYPRRASAS